jgi:mono/diheme cytochrome c family protein
MRYRMHPVFLIILALLLVACAGPRSLPIGPTPIPTLVPATEPATLPGSAATPAFTLLSYPARLPSAAIGQPLYQTHCAVCHGADGKGVVPGARNFNDLDYMRGETPATFYAIVTEGRGEMPSFRDMLTSDERWDVVFYTWRFSTNADTLALGKSLFEANCAACHGMDGVGKVLGAADFTDLRVMDDRAPRDFYLTVTQGRGSMPAWQGRLSQEERWAVIDYLRTFSYDATLPGETAATPTAQATVAEVTCTSNYISQSNSFAWDDAAAIAAGQVIYEQSCSICHGKDGSGAIPGAPDFTTAESQDELRSPSGDFPCVVAEGRGFMPGWKETLNPEQIWQVLVYIGSLGSP